MVEQIVTIDEKNRDKIEKQAYEWLAVMNSDCKTPEEVKQFQSWLEADMQHVVIYDEIYALWSELSNLQGVIEPSIYQDLGDKGFWQKFLHFDFDKPALSGVVMSTSVAFIGLSVFSIIALIVFSISQFDTSGRAGDYATKTAQIKAVNLPDTSVVTLGALSAMEVDYTASERRVELISGEAFFAVEHDAARPFVVTVADAEIRVLGTKFDVRRSSDGIRVSVLEGKVEVIQTLESEVNGVAKAVTNKKVLVAEERVRANPDGGLSEIQTIQRSLPGVWRDGRLIYENAKLSEVISDAERYYSGNIILDTDDLKDLPVSAAFRTDQILEMMDTLSVALPVSARKLSNGDIIIQRREKNRS